MGAATSLWLTLATIESARSRQRAKCPLWRAMASRAFETGIDLIDFPRLSSTVHKESQWMVMGTLLWLTRGIVVSSVWSLMVWLRPYSVVRCRPYFSPSVVVCIWYPVAPFRHWLPSRRVLRGGAGACPRLPGPSVCQVWILQVHVQSWVRGGQR
jgi:hypothetical protein